MTREEKVVKCRECGKYYFANRMTDDKRMCKDCYIKWLETDFVKMRTEQLEQENADLKRQAKALIEEMLPYMPKENIEGVYEIVTHAEEFMREIEK